MPVPEPPTAEQLSGPQAHTVLAQLRATRPVAWVPDLDGWLVTRHDLALAVMRDSAAFTVDDPRFSTARIVGPSMLSLDGAEHRRHRSPFVAPFLGRTVEARFAAETATLADDLLAPHLPRGSADLLRVLAGPLSVGVVAGALGLRRVEAQTVLGWYREIVAAVSELSLAGPGPESSERGVPDAAVRAVGSLAARLHETLAADAESVLRDATRTLDEAEIVANAAVMMFGGIETTEAMIATAILHTLQQPDLADLLRRDPARTADVVEESVRLEPAAAVVDRYATRAIELGGSRIAAGDLVRVSLAAANRDPAVFVDPDRFDPDRPNLHAQLAFARGPHACLAMDLARLETRTALDTVLRLLPELRLGGPVEVHGLVFRKPRGLPVAWTPPPA